MNVQLAGNEINLTKINSKYSVINKTNWRWFVYLTVTFKNSRYELCRYGRQKQRKKPIKRSRI